MILLVLFELIWAIISLFAFQSNVKVAARYLPFLLTLNVLTLFPFGKILRNLKELKSNDKREEFFGTWEQTALSYFVIVNILLMIFMIWTLNAPSYKWIF